MPYSAMFQGYIRTSPFFTMSLRYRRGASLLSVFLQNPRFLRPARGRTVVLAPVKMPTGRRFVVTCAAPVAPRTRSRDLALPYLQQQSSWYGRYAYDDLSEEDDFDREIESPQQQMGVSTLDNIDEWKWKLTMLLRNNEEQELVSRERKDRRDFEQLSALATRMGLQSRQYSRVVVFSKVPLPNYRSDLDDKRPQREVILPFGLQREVEVHLNEYLSRKSLSTESFPENKFARSSSSKIAAIDELKEQQGSFRQADVAMEKIHQQKSLQLRDQQQKWQVVITAKYFRDMV